MEIYRRQTTLNTQFAKKVAEKLHKVEMDVYHRWTTVFSRSAAETDVAPIWFGLARVFVNLHFNMVKLCQRFS